ncbi:hypothetical protein [Enterobacter roggenkampii]|uniref:hypothetical protein n=1 Tax=Enterobacter roggenkampii TaxID=1812935 RepID=UPI003D7D9F58
MKLIDAVVEKYPIGTWPAGMLAVGPMYTFNAFVGRKIKDDEYVTREQYEAALEASKPEWDGEGLPPVGCECEYKDTGTGEWIPVEIKYSSSQIVVFSGRIRFGESAVEISKDVVIDKPQFRPIRSEADKKRENGVLSLAKAAGAMPFRYGETLSDGELLGSSWYELYDKIAAGEVAGIRID